MAPGCRPQRAWCWLCWRSAARPGKAGMSAPRRNARRRPLRSPPEGSMSWSTVSSQRSSTPDRYRWRGPTKRSPNRRPCAAATGRMYTVAGSDLFTSARILAAEQRLVAEADRTDGRTVDGGIVELALLEQAANGIILDAGQAALVRSMSMSGARLQLAIAPAGAGKTTALRGLTRAWIDSGGQVLGLAPSAAAAAQLRESIGSPTDTLAKLTWSVDHGDLPDWALSVGPNMLVIIDEAGMVDTLSLDAAVDFIVQRGGSV